MDIKSKSKLVLVAWVMLITIGISGVFAFFNHAPRYLDGYIDTPGFHDEVERFKEFLYVYELNTMSKEDMKKEITVSKEEIDEHRNRYGSLTDQVSNINVQYEQQLQDAKDSGNKAVEEAITKERDAKIADITENFKSDEHVRAKIIKEKEEKIDEFYEDLENNRAEYRRISRAFNYYLTETETGEVFTNLNIPKGEDADDFINKQKMLFTESYPSNAYGYLQAGLTNRYFPSNEPVQEILNERNKVYEGKVGLLKNAPGSSIISDYQQFKRQQVVFFVYILISILAIVASIRMGRKKEIKSMLGVERWRPFYSKVPFDLRVILFGLTGIFTLMSLFWMSDEVHYFSGNPVRSGLDFLMALITAAVFLAGLYVQGRFFWEYKDDFKRLKSDWNDSLFVRTFGFIMDAFTIKSISIILLIILGIVFISGFIFGRTYFDFRWYLGHYLFGLVFVGLPILIIVLRNAGYFNKIALNVEELAKGNMVSDLPVRGRSVFAKLAADINTLRNEVKVSHKEQAKSERLKTELITNVSHDLRTPLTSIITYTELLKTPDLAPEDRDSYIEILDRKSKRLKVLIDDLFEATKMASGNIELHKDRVDLNQLLEQALAEHNETLVQSSLQLRVSKPDHPVYAFVDGQKLWRVFDNLIGNILKYSLENTRVYISVKEELNRAVLTFKNVTKYELGDDLDELFERFKRGDQSRHTEGSGLGLAIAKSIVDLHEGSLDIEVDGDLFKVTVILQKVN
ncbi:sensor histidine kinase [Mesobacillus subterraneus]|uniref:histidine kinase n=1 Tax=Mesobacillus subterraneus TaxID=285983 RepID=A0A427TS56_9BACI|nr:MFS domain-containing histidine kinase [Mesobacillus subterraneus]RSD27242.1 sensor histidine kinase [Mesobacillus subterraneus]